MTDSHDHDALDRLLKDDAMRVSHALEGGAFEARVLASLPAPRPRHADWWKPVLVLASAALGSVLAIAFAPGDSTLLRGFLDLAQQRYTPAAITGIAMSVALFAAAIVVAAEAD
jgi:hypothetical protein